jgi:hypothetical protein
VRNDKQVNFDWGNGSPAQGIPADNFAARWTRRLDFAAGTYRFQVTADDGVQLWVDGQLLIDQWHDSTSQLYSANLTLAQGQHDVRLQMYEHTGLAGIHFWWEKVQSYPDYKGEYFSNADLAGNPALVRNDSGIDFNWGAGSPAQGLPADNFSVRWTRQVAYGAGSYRFYVQVDDGARLWVDGQLVVDQWHDGNGNYSGDIYLTEGNHALRLEMYERTGGAMVRMWWQEITGYPDWKGEYFANPDLAGKPALVRNDANVDFNWGAGSPNPGLPADDFSVRWTRHIDFQEGTYRFYIRADDGVSVEMDDQKPFIREWHDGLGATYTADVYVSGGDHKVRVEYYEHLGGAMVQFWWEKLP